MNNFIKCSKKLVILLSLTLCFGSVFAYPLAGMFISAGGGVDVISRGSIDNADFSISQSSHTSTSYSTMSYANVTSITPTANFGIGYGQLFGNVYLGLEGNYYLFGGKTNNIRSDGQSIPGAKITLSDEVRFLNQFGASALLGYKWQHWMTFIRLGYVNAALKLESSAFYNPVIGESVALSSNKSTRLNGGLIGLGLRLPVSNHVSLSAEYDYSLYENKTLTISADGQDPYLNKYHTESVINLHHIHSSTGLVSLIYTF